MRPNNTDVQKRLLCVDDEKGVVVALCRLLHLLLYRVLTARDGEEELLVAPTERPDRKRGLAMARSVIRALLLALVMIAGWADTPAQAKEALPSDLTELSLEELMELEIIPTNVMGIHIHRADEWMLGYKFRFMRMDGNRDGTDRKSEDDVLQDFMVAPTDMTMEMHMVEVMYGVTDDLTLMVLLPYKRLSMDHIIRIGARFTTESEGIGDVQAMGHYSLYRSDPHWFILFSSLSFPTGSIDEKDDTPAGLDQKLPYPMQLGSGTFGLIPGITYLGQTDNWNWGAHVMGNIRLGENSNDYTLGNRYHLTTWETHKLTDWLSTRVRIYGHIWGNIDGADPDLNSAMVPTADPDRRGGKRIDLLLSLDFYVFKGYWSSIESGLPIYQSLNGPQLETDWRLSTGWQWTF